MKDFFGWTCIAFVLICLAGGGARVLDGIADAIAMFRARREQKSEIEREPSAAWPHGEHCTIPRCPHCGNAR